MTRETNSSPPWPRDHSDEIAEAKQLLSRANAQVRRVRQSKTQGLKAHSDMARANERLELRYDARVDEIRGKAEALYRQPFWIFHHAGLRLRLLMALTLVAGVLWLLLRIAAGLLAGYIFVFYIVPAVLRLLGSILFVILGL